VLTIDPARRLAQSLGLTELDNTPRQVKGVSTASGGELHAMMLDMKRTFDEVVSAHSTSERAEQIFANPFYQALSTSFAGTQEYMAMEKLVAVQRDPRFDLVILDTPPTANALDFLDAPGRLVEAVDSPTMRWFVQAFESTGKVGFNLLARSAAIVLRGLGRITGGGFLAAMAEFITELNDLFGGFKQRAQMVESSLRSPEVSFVLVTSPAPVSVEEAIFFSERLERANMPRGAFVVNRFRLPPLWTDAPPHENDAATAIAAHGLHLEDGAPTRVVRAHADAVRLATRDAANVSTLRERASAEVPVVRVPELASDVHDLKNLRDIAELLMSGGV